LAGRAGRAGLDTAGEAIVLCDRCTADGRPARDVSWPGFPLAARSFVVLRSTFEGGAAPARSYHAEGRLVWRPSGEQAEAARALASLAAWRAQRSISLA
jgi:hypothetical protein